MVALVIDIRMRSLIRAHEQGRQGAGECVVALVIDIRMRSLISWIESGVG